MFRSHPATVSMQRKFITSYGNSMTIRELSDIIKTERLEMRKLEPSPENARLVFEALQGERMEDYLYGPPASAISLYLPRNIDDVLAMMKKHEEYDSKNNSASYYIFNNGKLIGQRQFSYYTYNKTFNFDEVWFVKSARRKGFAKETMTVLENIAFNELGANRTTRWCYPENIASKKLAESMGYHLDGCSRQQDMHTDGTFHDNLFWSKLKSEYKG